MQRRRQQQQLQGAKSGTLRSYREDKVSVVIRGNTPDDLIPEVTAENGRSRRRARYQAEDVVWSVNLMCVFEKETESQTGDKRPSLTKRQEEQGERLRV